MSRYVSPHSGPIDQRALSRLPPSVLLERISIVLKNMGLAFTFGEDPYKLVVIKNPLEDEYDFTKRRPSIQSSSSKRSTRKPLGSSITSLFQKFRYISLFGFQYNRGYDGSTFIPPLINYNRPAANTFVKFHVVVHRIRDLDGLYIVDLKRHKGDIWEFKRIYSEVIGKLELDRD
jgi:Kinase associated domain 1